MTSDDQTTRIPRAGESAPDFEAQALDGTTIALANHPKPVAMVFLRHLA